jgi:NADPH-dependent curcumin reductase CurA
MCLRGLYDLAAKVLDNAPRAMEKLVKGHNFGRRQLPTV